MPGALKLACFLTAAALLAVGASHAQTVPEAPRAAAAAAEPLLFAVEIKTGPRWDASKAPNEQAGFREHSANLRRLRETGALVMGARYADKGLVVIAAASVAEVKAMMDADPSFGLGTFVYEVHPFGVFYGGELRPRARR
jgi:hypothetical protein